MGMGMGRERGRGRGREGTSLSARRADLLPGCAEGTFLHPCTSHWREGSWAGPLFRRPGPSSSISWPRVLGPCPTQPQAPAGTCHCLHTVTPNGGPNPHQPRAPGTQLVPSPCCGPGVQFMVESGWRGDGGCFSSCRLILSRLGDHASLLPGCAHRGTQPLGSWGLGKLMFSARGLLLP